MNTASRELPRDLFSLLQVRAEGDTAFAGTHSVPNIGGKVFGGQLMAQGIAAAAADVEPERRLHMLQASFLKPVSMSSAPLYTVRRTLEGRSYSRRDVELQADGQLAFQMVCSFKRPEDAVAHATPMPTVPDPDRLPSLAELAVEYRSDITEGMARVLGGIPHYEIRPVHGRAFLFGPGAPRLQYWMKAGDLRGSPDARTREKAMAFLSDAFFNSAMLMPHITLRLGRNFAAPTLNHSLWLHGSLPVDEWLLFDTDSPAAQDGCGLVTGAIYDRRGTRMGTAVQESVFRMF